MIGMQCEDRIECLDLDLLEYNLYRLYLCRCHTTHHYHRASSLRYSNTVLDGLRAAGAVEDHVYPDPGEPQHLAPDIHLTRV